MFQIKLLFATVVFMHAMDTFILKAFADRYRTQGYVVVDETKTYYEAQEYCATVYGTELATIESGEDNFQIRMTALSAGFVLAEDLWIGLSHAHSNGVWDEWDDGQRRVYGHWGPGQPNGDETCTIMSARYGDQWDDVDCENEYRFVCNKQMTYWYHNTTKKIYPVAEEYCQTNYGTHLATIHRRSESNRIRDIVGYPTVNIWMGLNDMDDEGNWDQYNDGSYVTEFAKFVTKNRDPDYDYGWQPGEPNDHGGDEDCGHIWIYQRSDRNQYRWNDQDCHSTEGYWACNKIVSDTCNIQCIL